jgi:hypothetical protein
MVSVIVGVEATVGEEIGNPSGEIGEEVDDGLGGRELSWGLADGWLRLVSRTGSAKLHAPRRNSIRPRTHREIKILSIPQ